MEKPLHCRELPIPRDSSTSYYFFFLAGFLAAFFFATGSHLQSG
jgi:hypothetical protein